MGRPTKRTQQTQDAITDALRKGNTKAAAAAAGGIGYSTMREWELAFPEFAEAIEKAEQDAQRSLLADIVADKSWQSKAWVLERRWPKEYGRREAVEMTGKDGGPIDTRTVTDLPDHERVALAEAIRSHLRSERRSEPSPAGPGED